VKGAGPPMREVTEEDDPSAREELSGLGSQRSGPSSWSNTADADIQRDLLMANALAGPAARVDRFVVERALGAGATAAVYAAHDPLFERPVALKIFGRAASGQGGGFGERLIREARALARLKHPNVVAVYEAGQWKQRPFIVMELIDGSTLARWLSAEPRSVEEILGVYLQAGRGLEAAHAAGLVHRDFKPSNVLVSQDGRVVVSDFGLVDQAAPMAALASGSLDGSVSASPLASAAKTVGTPAYAAPEQRVGTAAHPRADVYSFAISLVEAVLGVHPRSAVSEASEVGDGGDRGEDHARSQGREAWKTALRARLPRRQAAALEAALVRDPRRRTQTLAPLLAALSPAPVPRRGRRNAALLAALALCSTVGGWGAWRGCRAPAKVAAVMVASAPDAQSAPDAPDAHNAPNAHNAPDAPDAPDAPFYSVGVSPRPLAAAAASLLRVPPDRRGEQWRVRARSLLMLPVPTLLPCPWPGAVSSAEVLPDAVLAIDAAGVLRRCDLASGRVTEVTTGVACMRAGHDGRVAVVARDLAVTIYQGGPGEWRAVAHDVLSTLPSVEHTGLCSRWVGAADGSRPLLDGSERAPQGLRVWRDQRGALMTQPNNRAPVTLSRDASEVAFDDALRVVVVAGRDQLTLHDLSSGRQVRDPLTAARDGEMRAVAITASGDAAFALTGRGAIYWWRRGEPWRTQESDLATPSGAALDASGARALAWDDNGRLDVWELPAGHRTLLSSALIRSAGFVAQDRVVAIDAAGQVWSWSLSEQRSWVIADHAPNGRMWGTAICPDGAVASAVNQAGDDVLLSSTAASGAPPQRFATRGARVYSLLCTSDELWAGTRDGHLLRWRRDAPETPTDLDLGVRAWVWTMVLARAPGRPSVALLGMGMAPHGKDVTGGRVLALSQGVLRTVFAAKHGYSTGIAQLAVSADGRLAAAVASSGELALLDLSTFSPRWSVTAHVHGEARRVQFDDGDRELVTVGDDGALRRWAVSDGKPRGEIALGHRANYDLDVLGDTAVVGSSDAHVGTWDLSAGRELRSFRGHDTAVMAVQLDRREPSARRRWIVSGDSSGRVCLQRTDAPGCNLWLLGHEEGEAVRWVHVLDDGTILSAADDGTVRGWNPIEQGDAGDLGCELQRRSSFSAGGAASTCLKAARAEPRR
jgi:WD40 repeat protein